MDNTREQLIHKFKDEVIEACGVLDITAEEIANDAPLFGGEGINLDSLDALELIMLLEQNFGLKIKGREGSNHIFTSFDGIADYIFDKAPQERIQAYAKS